MNCIEKDSWLEGGGGGGGGWQVFSLLVQNRVNLMVNNGPARSIEF